MLTRAIIDAGVVSKDLHALLEDVVDPKEPDNPHPGLIYGTTTGSYSWSKTDHCQFVKPEAITSTVRDATTDVKACHADQTDVRNLTNLRVRA